jgi:hypothetical protein
VENNGLAFSLWRFSDLPKAEQHRLFQAVQDTLFPEPKADIATNYKAFAKKKGIPHEIINSNKGEHVKKGVYHIQLTPIISV